MPVAHAPLHASLAEIAGVSELSAPVDAPLPSADLDPLPSFEVPIDRRVVTARALAAAAAAAGPGTEHVTGVAGGAAALIIRALAHKTARRIVALTADA